MDSKIYSEENIYNDILYDISRLFIKEIVSAKKKFYKFPYDPIHGAAVIQEECGELIRACLDFTYQKQSFQIENMKKEAIQIGAMAIRFLYYLQKGLFSNSDNPPRYTED